VQAKIDKINLVKKRTSYGGNIDVFKPARKEAMDGDERRTNQDYLRWRELKKQNVGLG
jgi:hypothetical protein